VNESFYSNKEVVSTWEKCSNTFVATFFPLGKTNALWKKISRFQQLTDETIAEAWERLRDYISACSHHGMEEWFIIQSFYHGLIHSTREHIDAAVGGCFSSHGIEEAHKLVEKIASNQSWDEKCTRTRTCKVHQLEEVDMLTTKINLLMKKLENPGPDHHKMVDARVTCEECGETGYMGIHCLTVSQDVNFTGNSNNGFHPGEGFNAGWNRLIFPFDNHQKCSMGQNFNRNEPSRKDITRDLVRINDQSGKKIHATDKLLENINAKMDNFTVATQNQLSFNKMLETWIQQISIALPSQSSGVSSKTTVQESVRSISTVFKEKAPKSTEGSPRGVGKDKKPSTAENVSTKFSRRVKNATPAVISSPITPLT
jgi:hypothetical protein